MTSDEIRERFLAYFEERGHHRLPSASLVPRNDPSTLLISAGMHPLKPYFLGREEPPRTRLTSVQKCFRTVDIDVIGTTYRHLTFFEMLGNFSIGDYFKQGAVEFAWDFSLNGFGFDPERIWVTIFEGDDALGLGPDDEAIEAWLAVGVPRERIVALPRSENFWQAGPTGPCGPCSELYLDRGLEFGAPDDLPGGENERFLEYWNLVFMQYDQHPEGVLTPLPANNIDTGLGLNRLAAIMQGTTSVFETDQIRPLIDLGAELSGRPYGEGEQTDRSLRILADHARGMNFLIADGVVPSNEDRGYVLRRVMRRAIQHGRGLGMEPGFLGRYADVVRETMAGAYPELDAERDAIRRWLASEEEGFGRTLEQGSRLLEELMARARERGDEGIASEDAFRLHDTYGFPIDLTLELVAEHGLGVDEEGFEALMDQQRARARSRASSGRPGGDELRERAEAFARRAGFGTQFVGYETTDRHTSVGAIEPAGEDGRVLVKLAESPFYAAGGGQIADGGVIACEEGDCRATVRDVLRVGDDQAVVADVHLGAIEPGMRVLAQVDERARRATEANHTATHLLHAALRSALGAHVRQAGSYVGPDKLRFDFTHGKALTDEELRAVEDRVNELVLAGQPVRPFETTLEEARRLGAMALFGEKYGDVVRVVQIGDGSFSRELCGGTHVRSTAEIGVFRITSESSSAANVRRIEAVTGSVAVGLLREHDRLLREVAALVRRTPEGVVEAVARLQADLRAAAKSATAGGVAGGRVIEPSTESAARIDGAVVLVEQVDGADPKTLRDMADRLRGRLGEEAAVVLGAAAEGRVHLVATVGKPLIARGVKAGAIVREAAEVAGGGGGGKDTMAQAGGRDPSKLGAALETARAAIASALGAAP